jgi:DNA-binding XRE family transcriptional regulator
MAAAQLCSIQNVRRVLGKTQSEVAELLGLSVRSVQSYEQGWRLCPPHVQKLAGLLLFLNWSGGRNIKPCYQIMKCSKECQAICPAKRFGGGQLCWMITGTCCGGQKQRNWQSKIEVCLKCPVIKPWLPV